jgi:hypothetical protein
MPGRWAGKKVARFRLQHDDQQSRHGYHSHSAPRRAQEIADGHSQLFQELIQAGYRTLAKKYHPDVSPGDAVAAEKMRALNRMVKALRGSS